MKQSILIRLKALHKRYEEVQNLLSNSEITADQNRFHALLREHAQLNDISQCFISWKKYQEDIEIAQMMFDELDVNEIVKEELRVAKLRVNEAEQRLKILLLPKDPNDERSAFLEIRAGTGGNEAALFAGELFRMYSRYAESRRWYMEIIGANEGEYGGYKEIIAKISGKDVYGSLKFESGGHRVQRVPETESQGRIHTSSCTVAIIPDLPKSALQSIKHTDLRIDTFRSSGAGGQHVNTTESAIRITHLPSGVVVECQDERSQHKNKEKALSVLTARIHNLETMKRKKSEESTRRNLLGSGDRNDRNRTYNFSQKRVTDHRINLTVYRLDEIMEGKLDILIDPIIQKFQSDQLSELVEQN